MATVNQMQEPKRAADAIADALIGQIRNGSITLNDALPTERELCEQFSASRPTVREALSQMQMRGYVETGGGKRPRAAKPSIQAILMTTGSHLREILGDAESAAHLEQMRQFIEAGAAREAANRADNVQITKLQTALEKNFTSIGTVDFPATDIAFHRAIVSVVGNPVILQLHDMFVSALLEHRPAMSEPEKHDTIAYEEHREIYQAILNGDVVTATNVTEKHLARSYRARLRVPKHADLSNQTQLSGQEQKP
ncbi:FCD domain-containing protein [uncultured Maritalea sp.]|uniref:FCD domain-containing protein n=1 Tax=uncultured Maritalea sp. TaxID=757249 RepID=UPI002620A52C|nr:FCD domain-containing protein [uncultured Maritalea sp.]